MGIAWTKHSGTTMKTKFTKLNSNVLLLALSIFLSDFYINLAVTKTRNQKQRKVTRSNQ